MDFFERILFPIEFRNSENSSRMIKNGLVVKGWLKADLHMITPHQTLSAIRQCCTEMERPTQGQGSTLIHPSLGMFSVDILNSIREYEIDLIIIESNCGQSETKELQSWEKDVLQKSEIPTLIMPSFFDMSHFTCKSLLVTMSGEAKMSASLDFGIHFAHEMNIPLDLLHVTEMEGDESRDSSTIGGFGDDFYHEYPKLIDQFISERSPYSSIRDKLIIRQFSHCCGDTCEEIIRRMNKSKTNIVVLEWKCILESGHARIIKSILADQRLPIFLIRETPAGPSTLKQIKAIERTAKI